MSELKLLLINGSIVIGITVADVEIALKLAVLGSSLVYTLWNIIDKSRKK